MKRSRLFRWGVALLVLSAATAACGPGAAKKPIKIGVLLPLTGYGGVIGEEGVKGIKFYLEQEARNQAAGRNIELVIEDSKGEPDTGLTKAKKLVENDRIDVLIGPLFSSVGFAVRDYIIRQGIPQVYPISGNLAESGEPRAAHIFRINHVNQVLGDVLAKPTFDLGYKKVVVMAMDYVSGREIAANFIKKYKALGGKIVQEIYPKVGAPDYAPFLTAIKASEADAVWAFFVGADQIRFLSQATEFGIRQRLPFVGPYLMDDLGVPFAKQNAEGVITFIPYGAQLDIPANRSFVEAYKQKYGIIPNTYAVDAYKAVRVVVEAVKAVQGNVEDRAKFIEALQRVEFDSPEGRFKFDKRGIAVITYYAFRVERVGGEFRLVPIQRLVTFDSFGVVE